MLRRGFQVARFREEKYRELTNIQRTPKTQQKENNLIKKWIKDPNRHLSKEGNQMANKHEKRLHIICHQGNANKNNYEILLDTY